MATLSPLRAASPSRDSAGSMSGSSSGSYSAGGPPPHSRAPPPRRSPPGPSSGSPPRVRPLQHDDAPPLAGVSPRPRQPVRLYLLDRQPRQPRQLPRVRRDHRRRRQLLPPPLELREVVQPVGIDHHAPERLSLQQRQQGGHERAHVPLLAQPRPHQQ